MIRRCPVCRRSVKPTRTGLIVGHWDRLGLDVCPGSWNRYDICLEEVAS